MARHWNASPLQQMAAPSRNRANKDLALFSVYYFIIVKISNKWTYIDTFQVVTKMQYNT